MTAIKNHTSLYDAKPDFRHTVVGYSLVHSPQSAARSTMVSPGPLFQTG